MKVRVKFQKVGAMKFIGHLDFMRFFQKAMRRAQIPVAFSGGYSPHMIMSFASPLGVGMTTGGDYFDMELKEPIASETAVTQINQAMVEGVKVLSFLQIPEEKKHSAMSIVAAADYLVHLTDGALPTGWEQQTETFMQQNEIPIQKKTKRSEQEVDIRPMIYKFVPQDGGIFMQVAAGSAANLKPGLVMEAFCNYLNVNPEQIRTLNHRLEMYANVKDRLVTLESLGTVIE